MPPFGTPTRTSRTCTTATRTELPAAAPVATDPDMPQASDPVEVAGLRWWCAIRDSNPEPPDVDRPVILAVLRGVFAEESSGQYPPAMVVSVVTWPPM